MRRRSSKGFSLVELLLVLGLLGIISGIAIPAFLGQRKRARVIGDAQSNARSLAMALEATRAERGIYGTGTVNWTYDPSTKQTSAPSASTNPAPGFNPSGNSKMSYSIAFTASGIGYALTVSDPSKSTEPTVLTMDQGGKITTNDKY